MELWCLSRDCAYDENVLVIKLTLFTCYYNETHAYLACV